LRSLQVRERVSASGEATIRYVVLPERRTVLAAFSLRDGASCSGVLPGQVDEGTWVEIALSGRPAQPESLVWKRPGRALTQYAWLGLDGELQMLTFVDGEQAGCSVEPQEFGDRVLTGRPG
jgi:hypothetical protein